MIYRALVIFSNATVGGSSVLYTPSKNFENTVPKTMAS